MAHYHYLAKKIAIYQLFWKYIEIYHFYETWVCCETQILKTWVLWKIYSEKFWKFFMVLEFMELEYHKNF